MSNASHYVGGSPEISDRRLHSRQQVRSLAYIELGEGNGGIVLNVSEGGLAVQAVMGLLQDHLPNMRFQFSPSKNWLETSGRIAWTSESRKTAGVEFVFLPEEAREQLKEWISLEARSSEIPEEQEVHARFEKTAQVSSAPPSREPTNPIPAPEPETAVTADENQNQQTVPAGEPVEVPPAAETPGAAAASLRAVFMSRNTSAGGRPRKWPLAVLVGGLIAIASVGAGWMVERSSLNEASKKTDLIVPSKSAAAAQTAREVSPSQGSVAAASGSGSKSALRRMPEPSNQGSGSRPSGSYDSRVPRSLQSDAVPQTGQQSGGALQYGHLVYRVEPLYPSGAIADHVEGTVKLHAVIARDGTVRSLEPVSGPALLMTASMNAVRQWRYEPSLFETEQEVVIEFRLTQSRE
jgi:outer membrane biosynthesis protein TonB